MYKVNEICNMIEAWVPQSLKSEGDNVGLLVGDRNRDVSKILVAFEVTSDIINEATECGANMIVCHHPLIYYPPLKSVTADDYVGRLVMRLIENGISLYAAHSNLDWGEHGVCDTLAEAVGIEDARPFCTCEGRYGTIRPTSLIEFANTVKTALHCTHLKYVGEDDRIIRKIGLCSGAGGDLLDLAIEEGCDLFLSGEFKYHEAHKAYEQGIAIIAAGHFETENQVLNAVADYLKANTDLPIEVSTRNKSFYNYI